MTYFNKVKNLIKNECKYLLTDPAGIMCEANIAFAIYEKYQGVSDLACIGNRLLATATTFLGLGYLFSRTLDLSDKIFGIDRTKKGSKLRDTCIFVHDAAYGADITIACNIPIYLATNYLTGSPKPNSEVISIALASGILGFFNGGPATYSRDIFRDLVGIKSCSRILYPNIIRKRSPRTKKFLATGFVAASLAITAGIVGVTPSNSNPPTESVYPSQNLEEIVD